MKSFKVRFPVEVYAEIENGHDDHIRRDNVVFRVEAEDASAAVTYIGRAIRALLINTIQADRMAALGGKGPFDDLFAEGLQVKEEKT